MLPQIFSNPNGGAVTGEIRAFVGALPFGWLECNGAAFSESAYPRLKTVLGVATLPDLRGASLRGNDAANAAKTKSGVNSQAVPLLAHTHAVQEYSQTNLSAGTTNVPNPQTTVSTSTKSTLVNSQLVTVQSAGTASASMDVRGLSYYVKFAVYAL